MVVWEQTPMNGSSKESFPPTQSLGNFRLRDNAYLVSSLIENAINFFGSFVLIAEELIFHILFEIQYFLEKHY